MAVTLQQALASHRNLLGANFENLGKRIYLSHDATRGWSVENFTGCIGFIKNIFRYLGFYSSTHLKNISPLIQREVWVPFSVLNKITTCWRNRGGQPFVAPLPSGDPALCRELCYRNHQLPPELNLSQYTRLQTLILNDNNSTPLAVDFSRYPELMHVDFGKNRLEEAPDFSQNAQLVFIDLYQNRLVNPPSVIRNLRLKWLHLGGNELTQSPEVSANSELEVFYINSNRLTEAPDVSRNNRLRELYLYQNRLVLPPNILNNPQLQTLNLRMNHLIEPPNVSQNPRLKRLNLGYNRLIDCPDVSNNTLLKVLFLNHNQLDRLHDSIFRLPRNCTVYVKDNRLTTQYCAEIERRLAEIRSENPNLGPDILHDQYDWYHGKKD